MFQESHDHVLLLQMMGDGKVGGGSFMLRFGEGGYHIFIFFALFLCCY